MIPKVASWKKNTVSDLTEMLQKGGTFAVIDIHGVPAGAMLGMRAGLRGKMSIQVAKKRLMKLAWEATGNDFADLEELYSSLFLLFFQNLKTIMTCQKLAFLCF